MLIFLIIFILLLGITVEKFTNTTNLNNNQKYIITLKPYNTKNSGSSNNLSILINRNSKEINNLYNKIKKIDNKIIMIGLRVNRRYQTFSNSNNSVNIGVNKLNNI